MRVRKGGKVLKKTLVINGAKSANSVSVCQECFFFLPEEIRATSYFQRATCNNASLVMQTGTDNGELGLLTETMLFADHLASKISPQSATKMLRRLNVHFVVSKPSQEPNDVWLL